MQGVLSSIGMDFASWFGSIISVNFCLKKSHFRAILGLVFASRVVRGTHKEWLVGVVYARIQCVEQNKGRKLGLCLWSKYIEKWRTMLDVYLYIEITWFDLVVASYMSLLQTYIFYHSCNGRLWLQKVLFPLKFLLLQL